uniref:Cytochrome P450, family 1, subfamily C, polypeptide 2 n=1 Tax=Poecilia reticulata TaxID=8081 RepID=A0A3P9Q9X6_POERE
SGIIRLWSVQPALITSVVFLLCLEACLWVRNRKLKRRLPGPFAWPVVSNVLQLGQMPHVAFTKLAKKYGDVYKIRLGCSDIVVLNVILRDPRGPDTAQHRAYRENKAMRAFSSSNSHTKKAFEHQIVAEAAELVEIFLKLSTRDKYFNPRHELTVAVANVICALCFGKRYGHDDVEFRSLLHHVDQFGQMAGAGSLVDVMPWLQFFPNPVRSAFKTFKWLNEELFNFVSSKHIRDMSDAIIEVIDEFDGEHRAYSALPWIVLLPAKHPDIQTKLHDLIDRVVGRGRLPSVEDRVQMPYLDAFIYETMRFTSFVPVTIPHSTTWDVTVGGLSIPKDTVIVINQWSVNHDPLRWKDPHTFDLSDFLDENVSLDKDLTNNVLIFSAGKMRCIADQVAKVEIFLFFAILRIPKKKQVKILKKKKKSKLCF